LKRKIRVGIVGVGFGERVLLPAFRQNAQCEVLALCASTAAKAAKVAKRHHIARSFGDWRRIAADPDLDALAIATPPPWV